MIRGVIFDMDGVLIEAKEWHYEALNRALALFGYTITLSEHLASYDGLSTRQKLELLSERRGLPRHLHQVINELKQSYTAEIAEALCRPRGEHEYALARLKREGMLLAVASNSIRSTVELMMRKSRLDGYLDVVLSNEDVEHPKPSPDIYLKAMAALGLAPGECLVVEDNPNGIAAAQAAGAHLLQVAEVDEVSYDNLAARIAAIDRVVAA